MMGQMPKSANAGGNALVYNFFGEGSTDTADKDIDNFGLQFVIRVDRDGAEGPAAALLILDRLHGDAVFQANNVPTYGLHRHQLVITGGTGETHAVTHMTRTTYNPVDVDDPDRYIGYEMNFSGHIQTI